MTQNPARKPFRLLSMESLLALFGFFSLASGLWHGETMPIFWGCTILLGLVVLTLVRRKDWQKHWEEMERRKDRHD